MYKTEFQMGQALDIIIIMEKQQIPPQSPFSPFMFPFPFPYPPPPFANPMMNFPPKPPQNNPTEELYRPSPHHIPPFSFPPFPMMYPPPPEAFYRFHQQRNLTKEFGDLNPLQQIKERLQSRQDGKKKLGTASKLDQKKPNEIIILSDDESAVKQVRAPPILQKKNEANKINTSSLPNPDSKTLKTGKKVAPVVKPQPPVKKTRQIQKKKQVKVPKAKQDCQSFETKQVKFTTPTSTQTAHQPYIRSTRLKLLTIKQGKGKIMIGEEFQAKIPQFVTKDQSYSIWVTDVRKKLISRFQKDAL